MIVVAVFLPLGFRYTTCGDVTCALACWIHLYGHDQRVSVGGDVLSFPIPSHRGTDRCDRPAIRYGQTHKYAEANLKCAWILQGLVEQPGEFASVPGNSRMDALQSALFMLGCRRLREDAVVKNR